MGKKKRNRLADGQGRKKNDFLKTFKVQEFDGFVRFEIRVDSLKISCDAELRDYENTKALFIVGWKISLHDHKFMYVLHLLLEYMKYYSALNKLPLLHELPGSKKMEDYLNEEERTQRKALIDLYKKHEFKETEDGSNVFISGLEGICLPKAVDLIGIHYGTTNRLVVGGPSDRRPREKPVSLEPEPPQTESVPPEQD